ncbi:hypothetical protein A0H81_13120 [Grifola frondosa]|uniref:Uncharacterized protein n=1 Tax=Grifola frondosa TaxID=5627 RepID=A0A1C7LPP4_GRIFR|nr:hypothetical protein A0H81_13120 [Grifola frondosa]
MSWSCSRYVASSFLALSNRALARTLLQAMVYHDAGHLCPPLPRLSDMRPRFQRVTSTSSRCVAGMHVMRDVNLSMELLRRFESMRTWQKRDEDLYQFKVVGFRASGALQQPPYQRKYLNGMHPSGHCAYPWTLGSLYGSETPRRRISISLERKRAICLDILSQCTHLPSP